MNEPPTLSRDAVPGLAAILGGLLWALLAALLGIARAKPCAVGETAALGTVLRCMAEAEEPLFEEWVEWVAVPAPWRNTQGLWRYCARAWRGWAVPPRAWCQRHGRGPPAPFAAPCAASTGMA